MSSEKSAEAPKPQIPPSGLTPEMLAYINTTTSATIKELLAGMMPMIAAMALTPEKIALAEEIRRKPTAEQEAAIAREKRERALTKAEMEENEANKRTLQENCSHMYVTGQLAVSRISNYPDRQNRFLCHLCSTLFTPREWRVGPPTPDSPRGVPYVADEHPRYKDIAARMAVRLQG